MSDLMAPVRSPPSAQISQVVFRDRGGLFWLLVRNQLLGLVTLGIYRFWARVNLRRYWWGSIVIDGDPLEYTGTGIELFKGFLVALVVLTPLGVLYSVATSVLQRTVSGVLILVLVYVLVVFVLIPVVSFRARRYRLSRTVWRGIRGGMEGSSLRYALLTATGTLRCALTLGLYSPYLYVSQARYVMNNSFFGASKFRFEGRGRDLLPAWLFSIMPGIVAMPAAITFFVPFAPLLQELNKRHHTLPSVLLPPTLGAGLLLFAGWVGLFVGSACYQLIAFRYLVTHLTLPGVSFDSRIRPLRLTGALVARIALLVVLALVALAGLVVCCFRWSEHSESRQEIALWLLLPALLTLWSLFGIARIMLIDRLVVRRMAESVTIIGAEALAATRQSVLAVPDQGEGFADSFDIGAF